MSDRCAVKLHLTTLCGVLDESGDDDDEEDEEEAPALVPVPAVQVGVQPEHPV